MPEPLDQAVLGLTFAFATPAPPDTMSRRNGYRAVVSIVPVEGVWKINGIQVLEEKREL